MGIYSTTTQFIVKARKIHGDKYDYSKVNYIDQLTKIIIICPIHGEFSTTPKLHLQGRECPTCAIKTRAEKRKWDNEKFITQARKIHGDKYDYSKVEYKGANHPLTIICPIHGEFLQRANSHLRGYGCQECANKKRGSVEKIIKKIDNDSLDFSQSNYVNNKTPIKVTCKECGKEFFPRPDNLLHFKTGCPVCVKSSGVSMAENEINDFIKSLEIKTIQNVRDIIPPYELDIYIPDKKMAIELNGLYWHSQKQLEKRNEDAKKYHLNKTQMCEKAGIRLIHIFEDEWKFKKNIVENRLKHILGINRTIVGARKTTIKEINAKIKNDFLNIQHIQGADRATFKFGAFYKNELIGVMTFCKPRVSLGRNSKKENEYELSRFATKFGYSVSGLGSKMFKYFIRNYVVKEIYTYSDKRWNTGQLYLNMGMRFSHSSEPNYFYIIDEHRIHRFKYRKQELHKHLKNFDVTLTEYQNMLNNGFDRIFDCGNDKYIWKKPQAT